MVLPLVFSGLLGILAGRGLGGGSSPLLNISDVASPKKTISTQTTTNINKSNAFTDARTLSIILNSPNASITTKKDIATQQIPEITSIPSQFIPVGTSNIGGGSDDKSGSQQITDLLVTGAIVGTIGVIAYVIVKKGKK